jgi:hypothetical protein
VNGNSTPQDEYIEEGMRILQEAEKQGIVLKVMGAIAIRLRCPEFKGLHIKMEREISDIDFVGYDKQSSKIEEFFEGLGYQTRLLDYSFRQVGRLIFLDPTHGRHIDVFLDKLAMCHTIDYRNRLEIHPTTVPLAELLLQKMQIVMLSDKDVKDTIVLFREHDIGDSDGMINIDHIAKILANDWGFYHTVTTNLAKVKKLLPDYKHITEDDREIISERIDRALSRLEEEPKSLTWKLRSKIGTKKKWYKDVYSAPK